jgi:hypothetical protein
MAAGSVTATFDGDPLVVSVVSEQLIQATLPLSGKEIGASYEFVVTVDGEVGVAFSATLHSALSVYDGIEDVYHDSSVTLTVGYNDLHPDSPFRRANKAHLYSTIAIADQPDIAPFTIPDGLPVSMTSKGLVIIDTNGFGGFEAIQQVRFAVVDASDNYARGNESLWDFSGDVPLDLVVVDSYSTTENSATIHASYPSADITGIQYRVNGGIWFDYEEPLELTGLASGVTYQVQFRGVNVSLGGEITTINVTTLPVYDLVPDDFDDQVLFNHPLSQIVVFQSFRVLGASPGQGLALTVTNGEYALSTDNSNWSAFTSVSGQVQNGMYILPRHTASATYGASRSTVIDVNGVQAVLTSVTVGDTVAPVIALILGDLEWPLGVPWEERGYVAIDNVDGDLTDDVDVSGAVDHTVEGDYPIFYTVQDAAENVGTATRLVTIVGGLDPDLPILSGPTPTHLNVILPAGQSVLTSDHPSVVAWKALWSAVDVDDNTLTVNFNMPATMTVFESPVPVVVSATDSSNRSRSRSTLIYISAMSDTHAPALFSTGRTERFEQRGSRFYIVDKP